MSQALFLTREDITKFTALNGNIDPDKFIPFVKIAQDIHIQNYLGTDLFTKINNEIVAATITGAYLTLLTTYIKPMVVHWAMVEYLPWASYTIANKGLYKHGSENAENVGKEEVDFLIEKERDIAQHYTDRFIKYICNNTSTFPEYNSNSNGDVSPDHNAFHTGWIL